MFILRTGVGRLALCVSTIVALAACSHSPSEGDAKAVIKERLADCQYLSLDSFDRVNGIADGDSYYRVAVKYRLDISKPDKDLRDRFEEQAKLTDEIRQLQAEINASMKQSAAEADEYKRSHPDENFAEVDARFNQDASAQERDAKLARLQSLQENVRQNNAGVTFMQRIQNSCPHIESAWLTTAYQVPMDAIVDGAGKMDFSETIAMIKTDNGWQAAR